MRAMAVCDTAGGVSRRNATTTTTATATARVAHGRLRRNQCTHQHHRGRVALRQRRRGAVEAAAGAVPATEGSLVFGRGDGASNAFDAASVGNPVVKYFAGDDESRWMMWYSGADAEGAECVGLATSTDGIEWSRGNTFTETYRNDVNGQSVDVGKVLWANTEDWWTFDTRGVRVGDVQLISSDSISGGSVYWMFYHGSNFEEVNGVEGARTRPGLCLSQDGRNWARVEGEHHSGALFDVGQAGEWDEVDVPDPKVLLAGPNDIRVYYASIDAKTGASSIGLARTRDGFVYAKRPGAIFGPGPSGSFDDAGVASPCVVRLGRAEFIMFYEAYSSAAPGIASIAVATSKDGIEWTRPSAPALGPGVSGAWDEGGVGKPYAVPMAGDRVRLYYEGRNLGSSTGAGVGVALSSDSDRFVFNRRTRQ